MSWYIRYIVCIILQWLRMSVKAFQSPVTQLCVQKIPTFTLGEPPNKSSWFLFFADGNKSPVLWLDLCRNDIDGLVRERRNSSFDVFFDLRLHVSMSHPDHPRTRVKFIYVRGHTILFYQSNLNICIYFFYQFSFIWLIKPSMTPPSTHHHLPLNCPMPPLQWRHNERIGVSNQRRLDCLFDCSGADQRNIKAPRHWPLWWETTGDRCISLTKGQQATVLDARASRGKWPAQFMSHWYGKLFTE